MLCPEPNKKIECIDSGTHLLSRVCTTIGPTGLTSVFGKGTGVTLQEIAPESINSIYFFVLVRGSGKERVYPNRKYHQNNKYFYSIKTLEKMFEIASVARRREERSKLY